MQWVRCREGASDFRGLPLGGRLLEEGHTKTTCFTWHRLQKPQRTGLGVSSHWAETPPALHSLPLWSPAQWTLLNLMDSDPQTKPIKMEIRGTVCMQNVTVNKQSAELPRGKAAPSPVSSYLYGDHYQDWSRSNWSTKLQLFSQRLQQLHLGFIPPCESLLYFIL